MFTRDKSIIKMADEISRLESENKILRKQLYEQLQFSGKIIQNICSVHEIKVNSECNTCAGYGCICKGMLGGGHCSSFEDKSLYGKT